MIETRQYQGRFNFIWGYLEDNSIWVQPPTNNIFNIDYNTLRVAYDLNAGLSVDAVCRKYGAAEAEVNALLERFQRERAFVSPCCGRITFEHSREDISLTGYLIVFLCLVVIQIEYLSTFARTFFLARWQDVVLLTAIAIGVIFFHEAGHYIVSRRYFRGRPRVSFGLSLIFPVVYVDTHEAWRLPRNKRLLINSAGLFADMCVNTCAIALAVNFPVLEYFVTPLILAQFTRLSLVLNPLFATDGYWILADMSRTVNLEETAAQNLRGLKPNLYSLYGIAALVFSTVSTIGFIWFLVNFGYGLLRKISFLQRFLPF